MKIGFIGYGNMAEALASKWVGKHSLFIGGRNSEKAEKLASQLGSDVKYGTEKEAAALGEIVVLATPHEAVFDAIDAAGGSKALAGKVLIDINNPVDTSDFLTKSYDGVSLAEAIAVAAPQSHVVKAFNSRVPLRPSAMRGRSSICARQMFGKCNRPYLTIAAWL